jgi:hypothetical protein
MAPRKVTSLLSRKPSQSEQRLGRQKSPAAPQAAQRQQAPAPAVDRFARTLIWDAFPQDSTADDDWNR